MVQLFFVLRVVRHLPLSKVQLIQLELKASEPAMLLMCLVTPIHGTAVLLWD